MLWAKRIILLLMSGAAVWFITRPEPRLDVPPGFTVVEYWEKWVGNEGAQMQQIVDDFNRTEGLRKKIYVHYMSMSLIDQKTLVATAGGVPPDISGLWDAQIPQYAALGALEPLDDLAAAHHITEQTYQPMFWKDCLYGGHLYALVSTPATIALNYNKRMFRQAGLDPDRPPQTLDELDQYAARIDRFNSRGRLNAAGFIPLTNWYLIFMPAWFGGQLFDEKTQRFQLTSKPVVDAYRWIARCSKRVGPQAMQAFVDANSTFDSPQNPFLVDRLAMTEQGPWMANYINNLKPAMSAVLVPKDHEATLADRRDNYDWGVAPFPSVVAGLNDVTCGNLDMLVIPRGAKHRAQAFEFMAYLCRQDVTEKLNSMHSKNSPLRIVSDEFIRNHPNPYIKVFQDLAGSEHAVGIPRLPIWPEVNKQMTDIAQAVSVPDAPDAAIVLAEAQVRLQAKYDHFRDIQTQRDALMASH